MELIQKAYAKINLSLDIIKRLSSGYHKIESVIQELELHDIIKLKKIEKDIKLKCNINICPSNENLAYKAAELLIKKFKINRGVEITIEKNIPVAAGLGGGSSDAAATLKGMNKLFNLNLSEKELIKISGDIGVDVAFCLLGGTAYATGRGNELRRIGKVQMLYFVLAKPKFSILTKHAYENLDYEKTGKELKTAQMLDAIKEKNIKKIAESMHNDFEYIVCKEHPIINEIKQKMIENKALNALMSGSGPTVFGITKGKTIAEKIYNNLILYHYFKENLDFVCVTQTR
ncbi:4-(cytidine 5'-diphospho)-2-C-methyl-D-erythritol kinase [Candidatus Woesearchaeota archaeon]|nr:4-(cytidine 5'-diphospho)-2-C-methyl-D-erythritol kinase [Candidatus Woesearchaeota archaeon]